MSTRSIIARPLGDGFEGRYCHSDGYPSGVGKHLHEQFHTAFGGDLDAMIATMIDGEEIGWSSIWGHDLSMPKGWLEYDEMPRVTVTLPDGDTYEAVDYSAFGPQSYTSRGETAKPGDDRMIRWTGNPEKWDSWGTEWGYVLSPMGLMVFDIAYQGGPTYVAVVPWDDDSPDWERIECGDTFERCCHVEGYHEMLAAERAAA